MVYNWGICIITHARHSFLAAELWPLFHYMPPSSYTDSHRAQLDWEGYVAVNQAFANAVIEVYEAGDIGMYIRADWCGSEAIGRGEVQQRRVGRQNYSLGVIFLKANIVEDHPYPMIRVIVRYPSLDS
jgi:hypothetical protein